MSATVLSRLFLRKPLKNLITSVCLFSIAVHRINVTDSLPSLPLHVPCIFSQFLCVRKPYLMTQVLGEPVVLNLIPGQGTGSSNNYAYLVVDDKTKDAVIIDPANPPE